VLWRTGIVVFFLIYSFHFFLSTHNDNTY
jgi:hypothetical protein